MTILLTLKSAGVSNTREWLTANDLCSDSGVCELCPFEWIGKDGKCYYFSTEERDWDSSEQWCSSNGAHLVLIKSETQKEFITKWCSCKAYFIGLKWIKGDWTLIDGTLPDKSLFSLTDGKSGDCVYIEDGKLFSGLCITKRKWICMKNSTQS
ncbi:C-type lectin domain family 2 member B-like isoform X2 [Protopterus annectens]|nr:C-type lectin domain family 2 member B-like isoform X2 [Protopterus annectens]